MIGSQTHEKLLELLFEDYRYCIICGYDTNYYVSKISHIVDCLGRKRGRKSLVDKYYYCYGSKLVSRPEILARFPQLTVVNGLDTILNNYYPEFEKTPIEEIREELKTMNFYCLICGCNYETFPTKEILLSHLAECIRQKLN